MTGRVRQMGAGQEAGDARVRRPGANGYSGGEAVGGTVAGVLFAAGRVAVIAARIPCSSASGDGGHPGIATSTGNTSETAPTVA